MNYLIDKIIIFFISLSVYIHNVDDIYMIVPILITVFLSAVISYKEDSKVLITVFISFLLLCLFYPAFIFFIPLICYDLFFYKIKWIWALLLLPIFINYYSITNTSKVLIIAYILIGYNLKYRTNSFEGVRKNYYNVSDTAKELSIKF